MVQELVVAAQKQHDMLPWWGMMAPAGTPPAIVARLTQELQAASADQGVRERLKATFVQIEFAGPQEFAPSRCRARAIWRHHPRRQDQAGLGRVDGFDQDEPESKHDERAVMQC